jgi:hypothetical protein
MGKWAVWAAHRYVRAGASAPREVGADGRLLGRPWRVRSPEAVTKARRVRAARPQARWPKLLGWACIGVACVAAIQPVGPMPVDVRVSAATAPAPEPAGRALQIQGLRFDESRGAFRWEHLQGAGPYTFVVLGADYREVARFDGIGAAEWQPSGTVASALQAGATYHAFVRSVADRGTVRSALLRLTWR